MKKNVYVEIYIKLGNNLRQLAFICWDWNRNWHIMYERIASATVSDTDPERYIERESVCVVAFDFSRSEREDPARK